MIFFTPWEITHFMLRRKTCKSLFLWKCRVHLSLFSKVSTCKGNKRRCWNFPTISTDTGSTTSSCKDLTLKLCKIIFLHWIEKIQCNTSTLNLSSAVCHMTLDHTVHVVLNHTLLWILRYLDVYWSMIVCGVGLIDFYIWSLSIVFICYYTFFSITWDTF